MEGSQDFSLGVCSPGVGRAAAGTAITYLIELRLRADPNASMAEPGPSATSVNVVRTTEVGPLIAGLLAQWGSCNWTLPTS